ncbi:MarR family winged helix-turn-helix transcriptional regulator [Lacticaseibacillus hulanensis]|jgi:DNA-binding MarR family transcriptional regulator|uniref:MarR family winged helix-turn-helix transcriptional regulator n=1 Tax=Lacticaseibacillus hulanensis TaxID=2493111 RepID=UPI000FD756BF|nr:MarR family transcriptional regulator [Lacticaseibacillus hulanensis]
MAENVQTRSVTPVDEAIIDEFTRFSMYMADAQRRYDERTMTSGTRGQGKVLGILATSPHITQKQLVSQLHIRAASASELISKLEQKKLISRSRSSRDRRVVNIDLTPTGRAELRRYREFFAGVLVDLTEEERLGFKAVIRKLVSSVKSQYLL